MTPVLIVIVSNVFASTIVTGIRTLTPFGLRIGARSTSCGVSVRILLGRFLDVQSKRKFCIGLAKVAARAAISYNWSSTIHWSRFNNSPLNSEEVVRW